MPAMRLGGGYSEMRQMRGSEGWRWQGSEAGSSGNLDGCRVLMLGGCRLLMPGGSKKNTIAGISCLEVAGFSRVAGPHRRRRPTPASQAHTGVAGSHRPCQSGYFGTASRIGLITRSASEKITRATSENKKLAHIFLTRPLQPL